MTDLKKAAQQGLGALKCLVETYEMGNTIRADIMDAEEAIASLKAALEQPEQENPTRQMPEWMDYDQATDVLTIHGRRYSAAMFGERGFLSPAGTLLQVAEGQPDCVTLMTVAALEQTEQEPVAWWIVSETTDEEFVSVRPNDWSDINWEKHPLYTHPPRREWRSLSEEEILPLYSLLPSSHAEMLEFARAVEAALRRKNHE